jgi:hypothetical protein
VEEKSMTARAAVSKTEEAALARAHPLTQFGFDALVAGAARPRPGGLAFSDDLDGVVEEVTYADLYQRVGACLSRLRSFDFARGEKVLLCAPPGAQSFVALTSALAAGLAPVMAPMPLPPLRDAIARSAKEQLVSALLAPAQFCGVDFEAVLFDIAADTPSIRLIGALHGALDGAADFSAQALASQGAPRVRLSDDWTSDERLLVGALDDRGHIDFASQGALLGAALDLIRATRAAREAPILSLCAPSSLAALAAGPLAALLAGAPLHFLAPFTAARFLATLDALGPARLVAPASILADLDRSGLLDSGAVVAVAALCNRSNVAPLDIAGPCPIVELRYREGALITRRL